MEYAWQKQLAAVIIAIDFEKAFDRVEYKSLQIIMSNFNFGNEIIRMIMILYNDLTLQTINNGHVSPPFKPTRGILQGNPIASYAFLLIIEILAIKLRGNVKIKGIMVNGLINLLSQFADDLLLYLQYNQLSWNAVVQEFTDYERLSGMKVNYDKSVVYRIGSLQNSDAKFYSNRKLIWSDEPIHTLGVHITHDVNKQVKLNIEPLISKTEAILKIWSSRNLTLLRKILIINSLIASLHIYRLAVVPQIPEKYWCKIEKAITKFIWDEKRPKIKLTNLQGLKQNGGAGLVNLRNKDKSVKLQWVYKIQENIQLKTIAYQLLNNQINDQIWEMQLTPKDAE